MLLTTTQVEAKLNESVCKSLPKPARNKGGRGQLLEEMLGIPNSSRLTDMVDGELKSFTVGESIAITQLNHCLADIIDASVEFYDSKVYEKLKQTIYVAFSRSNEYMGSKTIREETDTEHFTKLAEDYGYISASVRQSYMNGQPLHTITGPNGLLQIRTKAAKRPDGTYKALCYNGVELKDKGMAFYLTNSFGKEVVSK